MIKETTVFACHDLEEFVPKYNLFCLKTRLTYALDAFAFNTLREIK